jgi:uncharacterized protein
MRSLIAGVAVLVMLAVHPSWAEENTKQALAKELFSAMDMEKQMEEGMGQAKQMHKELMAKMPSLQNADGTSMEVEDPFKDLNTDALSNDFTMIYAEVLTEEELQGLINFYKSDVGRKYVQKMPEITRRMMQVNQARTQEIQAKLQERIKASIERANTAPASAQ